MAKAKHKGDMGEAMVMAHAMRCGYKVAMPVGEDWPYDLIVLRGGRLERVQCKYVESDGAKVEVPCHTRSNVIYTQDSFDWLAVYDGAADQCYFIPSSMLGISGRRSITLRITRPANNQRAGIRMASDYTAW
jgi:hypothetical protein